MVLSFFNAPDAIKFIQGWQAVHITTSAVMKYIWQAYIFVTCIAIPKFKKCTNPNYGLLVPLF